MPVDHACRPALRLLSVVMGTWRALALGAVASVAVACAVPTEEAATTATAAPRAPLTLAPEPTTEAAPPPQLATSAPPAAISSTTTSTIPATTVPPTTAAPTTAAPPPPTIRPLVSVPANCDPNYTPCVPIDSDVDCAGGSGNGPSYVRGPVTVIGSDIYGLDRDGDGLGCE